jgi:hypothetical protein
MIIVPGGPWLIGTRVPGVTPLVEAGVPCAPPRAQVATVVPDALTTICSAGVVAAGLTPFAAWTVKENDPVALGVPDKTPVVELRVRPAGSVPLATEKAGAGSPLAVNV